MEQAANEHSDLIFFLLTTPELRSLAGEPRMRALLDRTGTPPSLRQTIGMVP